MKTIRILHILHSMNRGGAENAIMNYYRHIDRNLIQFDFLLTDKNKCDFEDEIMSLGGKVFRVPSMKVITPMPYLIGVWNFFTNHPEYQIIHSHTSSKSFFPLAIAKFKRIPVRCSHSHNTMSEEGYRGAVRNILMPFLKIVATDWLACGIKAGEWLYGKKAVDKGKVQIFKNVIEADRFAFDNKKRNEIREQLNISYDTMVIGHTARLNNQKNHLFDIDILKTLTNKDQKVILLLIGDGDLKDKIIQKAKENNVLNKIIFKGVVPNVYDYLMAMDVFILPSFYEGLPLSLVEAQISGLPCIVSDNVSKESSVTDLVSYISLDAKVEIWAEIIKSSIVENRRSYWKEIADAGYDAATSAKRLQQFYLGKISNNI